MPIAKYRYQMGGSLPAGTIDGCSSITLPERVRSTGVATSEIFSKSIAVRPIS
jgi:hypothetical protein